METETGSEEKLKIEQIEMQSRSSSNWRRPASVNIRNEREGSREADSGSPIFTIRKQVIIVIMVMIVIKVIIVIMVVMVIVADLSNLHDEKAGAKCEPSKHCCRVVATSERPDLQQEDASNLAQGKYRPNQPGGEVRDQNISQLLKISQRYPKYFRLSQNIQVRDLLPVCA